MKASPYLLPIGLILGYLTIPLSIGYYEYNYVEKDYVYSRGHYMSPGYICDNNVLYKKDIGAIFDKHGNNVPCKIINMTPREKNE